LFKLETCALLGCYAAYGDNTIPTFRDNLSIPSSIVIKSKKLTQKDTHFTQMST